MKTTTTFLRVRLLGALMIILLSMTSYGKNKVTITVIEKESGDRIPFSVISTPDKANNKPIGMTDMAGTFSTDELMSGKLITISSLGYSSVELYVPDKKTEIIVELKKGIELKPVTITASHVSLIGGCGGYLCSVVDAYDCFTTGVILKEKSDLKDELTLENTKQLKIYPNPSHGIVRIKSGEEDYLLEVFDCTGKLVQKFVYANDEQIIDLQNLKAGIYFCRITKESSTQTSRLVIN